MMINSKITPEILKQKTSLIKAIIFDVDGVITDGKIIYDSEGREIKNFYVKDGQIMPFLKKINFCVGAISGRKSEMVMQRAQDLNLNFCFMGVKDKLKIYETIKALFELKDEQIAYIGDDIIDLPILTRCGLSACPLDAIEYLKPYVDLVTDKKGGEGAFRDFVDFILEQQQRLNELLEPYLF